MNNGLQYINDLALSVSEDELIKKYSQYNHRTLPIEGDVVDIAVRNGFLNFLRFLVDQKREKLVQDHLITAVIAEAPTDMIKYLVTEKKLPVDASDSEGKTCLIHACSHKWAKNECVQTLLDLGANINAVDHEGFSPLLTCASSVQNMELLRHMMIFLFERDADEMAQTKEGKSIEDVLLGREFGRRDYNGVKHILISRVTWTQRKGFPETCRSFFVVFAEFEKSSIIAGIPNLPKVLSISQRFTELMTYCPSSSSVFDLLDPSVLLHVYSFLRFDF